jgi:hypothetical protein
MPFNGDRFALGEVRQELGDICSNAKNQEASIKKIWTLVVDRFNKAERAKSFVKSVSAAKLSEGQVLKILSHYDGQLSDITKENAQVMSEVAEGLYLKGTQNIPNAFKALVGRTDRHRGGTFSPDIGPNEIKGEVVKYRRYNNAEGYLPKLPASTPANERYLEWYVDGSKAKRFFTAYGKPNVWYTDGGTHEKADFWHSIDPENNWARSFAKEEE